MEKRPGLHSFSKTNPPEHTFWFITTVKSRGLWDEESFFLALMLAFQVLTAPLRLCDKKTNVNGHISIMIWLGPSSILFKSLLGVAS